MLEISPLKKENAIEIVKWCTNKDAGFLTQWAGRGYTYPIDENQIKKRLDDGVKIFEINQDGTMVGTIEIIYVDETQNSALIGRFVIDPELTGHGLGTAIIVRIN